MKIENYDENLLNEFKTDRKEIICLQKRLNELINIILGFQTKIITIQDEIIKVDKDGNKNGWTDTTDDKINDLSIYRDTISDYYYHYIALLEQTLNTYYKKINFDNDSKTHYLTFYKSLSNKQIEKYLFSSLDNTKLF